MARRGNTPSHDRKKHAGHRAHKRTRLVRLAARATRPNQPWNQQAWADEYDIHDAPPPLRMSPRKNKPNPNTKPQGGKGDNKGGSKTGRGGRGGKK